MRLPGRATAAGASQNRGRLSSQEFIERLRRLQEQVDQQAERLLEAERELKQAQEDLQGS